MISYVMAIIAALVFGVFFILRMQAKRAAAELARNDFRAVIKTILQNVSDEPTDTAGVDSWRGFWKSEQVQVRTIVDTLATRKLPTLWLSITVNERVNIDATFNMMARPNSVTTFSNFELLPHTVQTPAGFPDYAVVRTDNNEAALPLEIIRAHLGIFGNSKTKELLITPNGVRIVVLAAEADRARYGVFRQADFSGFQLDPAQIEELVSACSSLRADINSNANRVAT